MDPIYGGVHSAVAAMLDRPDLADTYNNVLAPEVPADPYPRSPGQVFSVNAGGSLEGRMSALALGLVVVGFVWFYIWTRGHQA